MALKFANNQSLKATTALPAAVPTDNLVLISSQTASNSANISFTTGLDSTYDEYIFKFINIKPATDGTNFEFQGSTNGGSSYGVTITSSSFEAYHDEADTGTALTYDSSNDLAQSTSYQNLANNIGNASDKNVSGSLQLFNPASTTYVKHFIGTINRLSSNDYTGNDFTAGYFNTTSAINAINFKMTSGNISDGTIKLYGVKKS